MTFRHNVALVSAAHEFGCYESSDVLPEPMCVKPAQAETAKGFSVRSGHTAGECVSWEEHKAELAGPIQGSQELAERVWQEADGGGAMFIWQMLLSF